jgi:hypothetical protein
MAPKTSLLGTRVGLPYAVIHMLYVLPDQRECSLHNMLDGWLLNV